MWAERDREQKALIEKLLREKEEAKKPPRLTATPLRSRPMQSHSADKPDIIQRLGDLKRDPSRGKLSTGHKIGPKALHF